MSKRGRPTLDTEWHAVTSQFESAIDDDPDENVHLVEAYRDTAILPHGCKLRVGMSDKIFEPVWLCSMYVGGKQRVIGWGTLYQCAKLYDAALLQFEKYRTHDGTYNYTRAEAQGFLNIERETAKWLSTLEGLLLARKQLTTRVDRENMRELRTTEGRHGRTAIGRVENTQRMMIDQIESIKISLKQIEESQRQSALTLAAINSRFASSAVIVENNVLPQIPAAANIFFSPTKNLTAPTGVKSNP